ncbi:hypothetical protein [Saccharopolyspora griseoalba]|uniref:Uncharacterized protein n=1 Tax=Saccharopolyspora griseoalba TaxID=1431848 RepID=A0ABW2LK79_9PSEU
MNLFPVLIGLVLGGAIGFGVGYLVFGKRRASSHQQGFGQPQWGQQPSQPQQQWGQPQQWQQPQPPQGFQQQPPQQYPPQQGFGQYPPR